MSKERLDPWLELQFTARSAVGGGVRPAAVALVAERCAFVRNDDLSSSGQAYGQLLNALKNACLAWRDAPDESCAFVVATVAGLLNALDAWPQALRPSPDDLKARPRARSTRVGEPKVPHWMRD